jgi:hypothetical protein
MSEYIPAFLGLMGVAVGGVTSFVSSWFTQHREFREKRIAATHAAREKLFAAFIREASRLYADALSHERDSPGDLVKLYSIHSRIRLVATEAVVNAAKKAMDTLVEAYLSPNRALHEIYADARAGRLVFLEEFSRSCREELERLSQMTGDA